MTAVKTAISLPAVLFEAVEHLSHELHMPRSRIFTMALSDFLKKTENHRLLKKLNAAYASGLDEEEKTQLKAAKQHHRSQMLEEW